jgi:hypothetical protein
MGGADPEPMHVTDRHQLLAHPSAGSDSPPQLNMLTYAWEIQSVPTSAGRVPP